MPGWTAQFRKTVQIFLALYTLTSLVWYRDPTVQQKKQKNPYGPSIRHYCVASKNDIGLHYLNRGRPNIFFLKTDFFFFLMLSERSLCKTLTPHYTHRSAQAQVCFKILSKKPKKCILTDFDSFWGFFDHFRAQRLYCKALYLSNIFHSTLQLIFMADIDQKNQN